ncbi:MAG: hypothetical protein JWM47_2626, partial [Acidimicrobiales bacterium]|nr:hypothetical protein [Acidimicrobiales bacterium]
MEANRLSDVILLDTSETDAASGDPVWSDDQRAEVLRRFAVRRFQVTYAADGVYLLERRKTRRP